MDRINSLFNSNNITEINDAIRVLRKYDLFSALLWKALPNMKSKDSLVVDKDALSASAAYAQGYKDALVDLEDPFIKLRKDDR